MPRIARVVAPGVPHHVTQRGNRRQRTFFGEEDYRAYISYAATWCRIFRVHIWAYCLMPNHVHLVAVPDDEHGLRKAIGETHRRYTVRVNSRNGWRGHLWQGRFFSCPMDESHTLAAARYIELNPVRAGFVDAPEQYKWSSARAHLQGVNDRLVKVAPLLDLTSSWQNLLSEDPQVDIGIFRRHEATGRPIGSDVFIQKLERETGRVLRRKKSGPKAGGGRAYDDIE